VCNNTNTVVLEVLRSNKESATSKERVALLRHSWMDESNMMLNDRYELHGSCRHTARFHRLFMRSGTDDSE
jgi:hypothetical protein